MDDIYVEQLVVKEETKKDNFKKMIIIGVACLVSLIFTYVFGDPVHASPLIIVTAIVANFFYKRLNIEYEYLYTNGTLDIDCIYNKSKRKHIFSVEVSEIYVMAHFDDKEHLAGYENAKVKDFSSGEVYGNTYIFVTHDSQQQIKVIIEPNEQLLNAMMSSLTPRKLFLKK